MYSTYSVRTLQFIEVHVQKTLLLIEKRQNLGPVHRKEQIYGARPRGLKTICAPRQVSTCTSMSASTRVQNIFTAAGTRVSI